MYIHCVCTYVVMYLCMYIHTYVCTYVRHTYMHTHATHTHTHTHTFVAHSCDSIFSCSLAIVSSRSLSSSLFSFVFFATSSAVVMNVGVMVSMSVI